MNSSKNIQVSLIIATYNWEDALELVLLSILNQTVQPTEIIIADDGSKEKTKTLVDSFKNKFTVPLIHVWHEDNGFRLAEIRNKAIKQAKGDYIVQIDGDVILHKNYIKDHILNARQGFFIVGSRVLLGEKISQEIVKTKQIKFHFFNNDIKNKQYTLRLPLVSKLLKSPTNDIDKVIRSARGCNMSFWKSDLIKVNGYDESMVGWGREDSEISARLINIGLKKQKLKFGGIQYHIYHPENSRKGINLNDAILENTVKNNIVFAKNGIYKKTLQKNGISAIILTLNEEKNIEEAIKSVQFADEIIVIDSLSTDRTVELAKKMKATVLLRKFDNFSNQKKHAIEHTKNDWIYILDADERVSNTLKNEILTKLKKPSEVAFSMKMNYYFMGKLMKHGSFKTKKVIRLFNKKFCKYDGKLVHEQFIINGKQGVLINYLDHKSNKTLNSFIQTQNFYAGLKAKESFQKKHKNLILKLLIKPPFRFFKHYIIQLGFLDGFQGFVFAGVQSYGVFIRYVKLWDLKNLK